ncbi:MAG: hypothetical protein ACK5C5_11070 [Bacteroidota bacterium]|jgi:hypothetical protein
MFLHLARLLSYVLHPLFMPFYAVMLVLNLNTYLAFSISGHVQQVVLSVVFITTAALPIITAVFLLQRGSIQSLEMESSRERQLPFVATAAYYLMGYYLLKQLPIPVLLANMVLGAALAILTAWLINFKWKISIHMVGIGGLAGLLTGLSIRLDAGLSAPIIYAILISGMLGNARILLGAHNPLQVYAGFTLGFVLEWLFLTL